MSDMVSVPREPTLEMLAAGAAHEWSSGYDRQGSHASGEYEDYTLGLRYAFGDNGGEYAAAEIYKAMLAAAPKPDVDAVVDALKLAHEMVESHYPSHREYKVAAALIALAALTKAGGRG